MERTLTLANRQFQISIEWKKPNFKLICINRAEETLRLQTVEKDIERIKEFYHYGDFTR